MKKIVIGSLLAVFLLTGTAFGQSNFPGQNRWGGISTGYPFGLVLHYGINDLVADNFDARFNLSAVTFLGGQFYVLGGADALYNLDIDTDSLPLDVYAGGGLGLGVGIGEGGGVSASVRGVGGVELAVSDQIGVFGELRVGLGFNPVFSPSLAIGANYHF